MKITKETIAILQNFAGINGNIQILPGKTLTTMSPLKNIFAKADIPDEFPNEFCIYDLNSLLSLLTLMEDQDVEFGPSSLKITKDGGEFEYFYADPNVIIAPPKGKNIEVAPHYTFNLASKDIIMLNKAASIIGAKSISVISKKGNTIISVGDPKTSGTNSYRKVLEPSSDDFSCQLSIENFKVIPDDYTISLSKVKFFHFKQEQKNLQYWIAMTADSVI